MRHLTAAWLPLTTRCRESAAIDPTAVRRDGQELQLRGIPPEERKALNCESGCWRSALRLTYGSLRSSVAGRRSGKKLLLFLPAVNKSASAARNAGTPCALCGGPPSCRIAYCGGLSPAKAALHMPSPVHGMPELRSCTKKLRCKDLMPSSFILLYDARPESSPQPEAGSCPERA